jgi:transglutaminase-like putative cysteine protease
VVHTTEYEYEAPVTLCHNEAHLIPRSFGSQRCLEHQVEIDPIPALAVERQDFFGNPVLYFAVQSSHSRLAVKATSDIELNAAPGQLHFQSTAPWEEAVSRMLDSRTDPDLDARQYRLDSPLVAPTSEIASYAVESFVPGRPLVEAVHDLMDRIHNDFVYDPHFTTVATPLSHVFEHRRGVCQDFAHLAIACLRSQGLGARYVSGYIETLPPPGQEKLVGADASHAWFSVYDPDVGWLDFDPTNNQIPMDQHITTAWGRDYYDITPIKGVIFGGGATHATNVAVDVSRLDA